MATVEIIAYKNAWKQGDPVILYVPFYTSQTSVNQTVKNASDLTIIDPNLTIIVPINSRQYAINQGFNVIDTDAVVGDSIEYYISDTNSFTVQYTSSTRYAVEFPWTKTDSSMGMAIPGYSEDVTETYSGGIDYRISTSSTNVSVTYKSAGSTSQKIYDFWTNAKIAGDDPYTDGGTSGTGGGTGTFSGTGDSIEFPNLPTLSAVSTGFITLFNPSIAQMQSLATYMWSDVFDIGLYKTLFADPMDCILGCSIVPVAVPNGGTKIVNVGNVSTGISMTVAASQYVEVDCGTLNVEEFWGSYLDYDPYTKAEIYLPYCGTHALQVDDIMGKAVHVKYHVDILSGACCAYVKCGSSVMYSFVGQCSSSIPISANDWTNVVNGALTIAASVGSLIATGGASAPMAVGAAAAVTGTIYGGGIKQNVEKSGSMGGTGGMLAVQTPYLILTRPRQALPKKQNTYTGYPSFITTKLSDLKGYTEIDSIRITGVPATDAELNELESILKSGVIF